MRTQHAILVTIFLVYETFQKLRDNFLYLDRFNIISSDRKQEVRKSRNFIYSA